MGTRSTPRKSNPSATLSTIKPVGLNTCLHSERPATLSYGTGNFDDQINPHNNKDSVSTSQTTQYASLETQIVRKLANGEKMVAWCEKYTVHKNGKKFGIFSV
jgi:hypothetical protein